MHSKEFHAIVEDQIETCLHVMGFKANEYATADRLHNFKVAAKLKGETPRQALLGMMVKHTVSIYDMGLSDERFSEEAWNEKITDHLNYLFLFKAIVMDEINEEKAAEIMQATTDSSQYDPTAT